MCVCCSLSREVVILWTQGRGRASVQKPIPTASSTRILHEIFENGFYRSTYPSGRQKFSAGCSQEHSWSHFSTVDRFPFDQARADQIRPMLCNGFGGSDFRSGFENIILLYFLDPWSDPWAPLERSVAPKKPFC